MSGRAPALAAVLGRLRCPHCGAPLALEGGALACARGHAYDVARQGYVALPAPGGRLPAGDGPAMVAARERFLGAGHFAPIARAVVAAAPVAGECALDLGAGTGWYLAALLRARPGWRGIALDASRPALRRAVRAHERIAGIACDGWGPLPLRDGSADVVLNVFAPRNAAEIARVLRPEGVLVVVTPAPDHLAPLVDALGLLAVDPGKRERLEAQLGSHLRRSGSRELRFAMALEHEAAVALAGMGPSAHHLPEAALGERLAALPEPVTVTGAVRVETFRRA